MQWQDYNDSVCNYIKSDTNLAFYAQYHGDKVQAM